MITNDEKWVRNFLLPHLLSSGKLVKDYSESGGFHLEDLKIEYLGTKEAFHLTICYRVKINFVYAGKDFSSALIVKKTPNVSKDVYDGVNFDTLFHNEIAAYTEIIPALGSTSSYYPKYYYSHRNENEAIIVLNDFSVDGWMMTKDRVNLSLEHVLLAVRIIANFHGQCYALKKNNPEKFYALVASLKESRYATDPPEHWWHIMSNCSARAIQSARNYYPKIHEEFLNNLTKLIGNIFTYGKKRVQPIEPMAVICHGDYLRNNIAFKYENENNPIQAIMFDFQTLRYSSPMIDLTVCLSFCPSAKTRSEHFNQIFNTYWNELTTTYCKEVKISLTDLPKFLSYGNMLIEYILYLPFGIATATSFLMSLYDPDTEMDPAELLEDARSPEEALQDTLTRGGEIVDKELAAIVDELYNLSVKYEVNIFENF